MGGDEFIWSAVVGYIDEGGAIETIGSESSHPALVCVMASIEASIEADTRFRTIQTGEDTPAYDVTIIRTRRTT
jgi:hypothetical protein